MFPNPDAIVSKGIHGLRQVNLSGKKSEYTLKIASDIQQSFLDLEDLRCRPDRIIAGRLMSLKGVGH